MDLILYDGVCGLCNRLNTFVLCRDHFHRFRFASLQSSTARALLIRHGKNPDDLDTLVLVLQYRTAEERLLVRSAAAVNILSGLGGMWRIVAGLASIVPVPVRDAFYRLVARTRYGIFGRYESCPLPNPGWRNQFIDV